MTAAVPRNTLSECSAADLLQEALVYRHGLRWTVLPLAAKVPTCRWTGLRDRRPTDRDLGRLWHSARRRVDGIGVIAGAISGGLCVRDFDQLDGYRAWADAHPRWAASLPTARTSRGVHVYARSADEAFRKFDDGELIANVKHYVVLPPSRHPCGVLYRWLTPAPSRPSDLPLVPLSVFTGADSRRRFDECRQPERRTDDGVPAWVEAAGERAVWEAIARTLPKRAGERNASLFRLARALKAIPNWRDGTAEALEPIVRRWHLRALDTIATKEWSITWDGFRAAWRDVKYPAGSGAFDAAMRAAAVGDTPDERLLALCQFLQNFHGERPFYLGTRDAARLSGFSQSTAARRLNSMCLPGGPLHLAQPGSGGSTLRQAASYRLHPHPPEASPQAPLEPLNSL